MQPAPSDPQTPSRRRPRLDSSSSNNKRARHHDNIDAMAAVAPSSRAKGKLPQGTNDPARPSSFQPYTGAKKLVIKNLRASTTPAREAKIEKHYAQAYAKLEASVDAVWAGGKPEVPLETLYRGVEDLCRRGDGDARKIYDMLRGKMENHVQKTILPRIEKSGRTSLIDTARAALTEWKAWNSQMILIRSTFSFLDRTYILREKLPSINDLTISQFRKMAFGYTGVSYSHCVGSKLCQAMCELIQADRQGQQMDAGLLRESLRMMYILNVYVKHFEPFFLKGSVPFFWEFADSHSIVSLKAYIQACEKLLNKEHYRCLEFNIDSTTEKQLLDSAHDILIDNYTEKLLDSDSLDKLLSSKDVESMKGLYDLLCLSKIQKKLRDPWAAYITAAGAAIIGDKEKGDEMVLRLLNLRRALDLMIRDAFGKDEDFTRGMREALGRIMNDRATAACWTSGTSKIGEMIAKHIDMLLRGGLKTLPASLLSDIKDRAAAEKQGQSNTADEDAELDRQLDQALELFRFIEGKDTFEAFYKKDLARRLLMGRSASQDAERSMLAKLRGECGANFTHNLEQMFKDQELAKDEMDSFKQYCNASEDRKSPVDLQVMVLSAAAWPTYPDVQLNLPDEVATQSERFEMFYKAKHTGRVLKWKHALAHCSIKAKFPKGVKELMVSAYQAVVLLLFNSTPAEGFLTFEQISKGTGLTGSDLTRTLQSLACGKARVLSKHPKGRDVNDTDTFTFNKAFTDPKYRVKINQIQHKETKEENKATHERIAQDRRFETQAAIVRIMKSRKQMSHPELQAEVINMTKKRGSVEPAAIKKEIESLIDKEYLERVEGNTYVYVS